jgi:hypothetical protein
VLEGAGERNQPLPTTEGIVPTQTTDRTFTRGDEGHPDSPGIRAAAELVPGETFTHTGVLIVRIRATTGEDAREALASAAHAALESALGIVRVEGTDVTRNPAPRRGGAR